MWCCSPTTIKKRKSVAITILHFNDVYNVEGQGEEPVGGAARFCSAMKSFKHLDPLIFFSGDILSPSVLSTFTQGEHMLEVLNSIDVSCCVYGNHDFDFGVDHLVDCVSRTSCPWLLSNVIDKETNAPLGDGLITHIIEHKGIKFGLVGLVEKEWLVTLATVDVDEIIYLDYVSEGRRLANHLKRNENVDYVIALTHMRFPNDCRLAENVEEIDLVLGGHDHVYDIVKKNNKSIIKSGTDFQRFSKISLIFSHSNINMKVEEVQITSAYEEDQELKEALKKYDGIIKVQMDKVLGHFSVDLDGRFSSIRTMETNLGNFLCDVMLAATHSDITIINSGAIRSDRIYQKGAFKLKDLITILPMIDPMVVLNCTASADMFWLQTIGTSVQSDRSLPGGLNMQINTASHSIWKALENGVSQYPKLEGRFPQVAGIRFVYDPTKPPGERIDPKYIKVGFEYLDLNQMYRVVTKKYCALGKDGYDVFKDCEILVDDENTPELSVSVQNHFNSIKILTGALSTRSHHRQSLFCMSRRASLKYFDETVRKSTVRRSASLDLYRQSIVNQAVSIEEVEIEQCKLSPKVEGRIRIVTDKILEELEEERNKFNFLDEVIEEENGCYTES